jgi:uncharacterized membrane protein
MHCLTSFVRLFALAVVLALFAPRPAISAVLYRLSHLPGGYFTSYATAVSDDGQTVVGHAAVPSGGTAFRWTTQAGMQPLHSNASGFVQTVPWDVSADGTVVVGEGDHRLGHRGFRWTEARGMEFIEGPTPGPIGSYAHGVSADGTVVVGWGYYQLGGRAYRWSRPTATITLSDLWSDETAP